MGTEATEDQVDDALVTFMGQLSAHGCTVRRIASHLDDEGIGSYARPLRAASKNLEHAFADLRHNLVGWESPEKMREEDVRALGRLVHGAALAADGELAVDGGRTREDMFCDLWEDAWAAYRRTLDARGVDYEADMDDRLEEIELLRCVGGDEASGDGD